MNLLLVEDDSEISQLLLRYLERQGFFVTHVTNGITAVETFVSAASAGRPFDVVLTDGLLPGKNGFQVAQAIRATPAGARVGMAMMSAAFRGNRARSDALNSGMDAYFAKPFVLTELREVLTQLARRHRDAVRPPTATVAADVPRTPTSSTSSTVAMRGIGRPVVEPPAGTLTSTDGAARPLPRSTTSPGSFGVGRSATSDIVGAAFSAPRTSTGPQPAVGRSPSTEGPAVLPRSPSAAVPVAVSSTRTMPGFNAPRTASGSSSGVGRPAPLPASVGGIVDVARLYLQASRRRFDGVLQIDDGPRTVRIAWLNGVIVGAADNAPEHALGQWLFNQGRLSRPQLDALDERLRTSGERVAEALLALGFVTGTEALALVEAQARARVRRSLGMQGRVNVSESVDLAGAMAVGIVDVVEVIAAVALEPAQRVLADVFVRNHGNEKLLRTPDFDVGLVAFARLRPTSTLPQELLTRELTVTDAAAVDAAATHALWLAGLVRTASDPDPGPRATARAVKTTVGGGAVDEAIVNRIATLLLRARGGSVYRLLDVPASTSTADLQRGLRALNDELGRDALSGARIGPASAAARELQTLIDEALFVFADDRRRKSYDDDLTGR